MPMRLKIQLLLVLIFWFVSAEAQQVNYNNPAEAVVNITNPSASLSEWFSLIQHNGIILSYSPSQLNMNKVITIGQGKKSVKILLKELLDNYEFKLLTEEKNKVIIQIKGLKPIRVSGTIKEESSGEKLYGATIHYISSGGKEYCTLSDERGFFTLLMPADTYRMVINYIGCESFKKEVYISGKTYSVYTISPALLPLNEIVVKPRISMEEFNEISPSNLLAFSSSDFFSQIRILPGIIGSQANENLQVNGGSGDENLVLLDGVPIYHTNHLNSMLPVFNGDAIKNVTFHKSYFPANFEGRLSSVTDIKLKEGNKKKYVQTLSLDMPSASAVLEGPIIREKLSYIIGARRSWLDFFDNMFFESEKVNHSFYDLNAKLSYDINKKFSIHGGFYRAGDDYYAPTEKRNRESVLNWKNDACYLKVNVLFGKIANSTTLSYTSYSNRIYGTEIGLTERKYIQSDIKNLLFSSDFTLNIDNIFKIDGGIKASRERFNIASGADTINITKKEITQFSFHYAANIMITEKFNAQVGVNLLGYIPDHDQNYFSIQPRFSLKYAPLNNHLLYLDFSRMEQFYHYIRLDALPLPTDFRMPSVNGFKPSSSEHYEAGWKYFLRSGIIESSLYYKRRHNIMAIRPDLFPLDGRWNKYIMQGEGESYGAKFHYFGSWHKFTIQFSYTWSRSKEWFKLYKNNLKVPSLYDIPHICNLAVTYNMTPYSGLSLGGNIRSGRIIDLTAVPADLNEIQFRNHRWNCNYRVDASYYYSKEFDKSKYKLFFRIGLYNIVGNPAQEDNLDFYSIYINNHCLPYLSISFRF